MQSSTAVLTAGQKLLLLLLLLLLHSSGCTHLPQTPVQITEALVEAGYGWPNVLPSAM